VHYGIRPGDIEIGAAGQGIAAKVVVVEPTGAETELLLEVGGTQMIVVLHGRTAARPDDVVGLNIAADKMHLFDQANGQRIE
jgi:multiple sugar transport system ATP-binding protein